MISIITPSYNQGEFLERTIQSVLSQNIESLEYWVIDGGSTDISISILKKYQSQLRWLSELDKGQANAINKGIQLSSGSIIGWLNSDDIYYPGALKTVSQFFTDYPEVDVLYGDAYHIDPHDRIIKNYDVEPWNLEKLKTNCYLSQPAVFFRRRVIEDFGLLQEDLHYCLDYEYWLRLALHHVSFHYLPQVFAGSRLHPRAKTIYARVKVHQEINDMLKQKFTQVPDRWLSNYAHAKTEAIQTRPHHRIATAIQTVIAAFRWNKWISKPLLRMSLALLKKA